MSDLTVLTPQITSEMSEAEKAFQSIKGIVVTSHNLVWAGETCRGAKTRAAQLEAKRVEITGPLLASKKAIDALFNPAIRHYLSVEADFKVKISEYHSTVERERLATMIASAAEYQAGGTPIAVIPAPVEVAGISFRKVIDFEITNPADVPRAFCVPDNALIKQAVAAGIAVPGVRVFERESVTARKVK